MKGGILSILFLLIAGIMAAQAFTPPPINRPSNPNQPWYPGTPPFNPKPLPGPWGRPHPRFRRDCGRGKGDDNNNNNNNDDKSRGQVVINAQHEGGKTTWDAQVQHNVWSNDKGSVWVSGGANKQPGQHTQGQVGIGGSIEW